MKKYLIDTNIFIEHFRGNKAATEFLASDNNLIVSYITMGELLQGARNKQEIEVINKVLHTYEHNLGSSKISSLALALISKYQPKYGLQLMDALIAATALVMNATLVTLNTKDFQFIDDLENKTL